MRVLYLDLDCVRADHPSLNGYPRETTPNVDRLGRDGLSFTRCFCSNSPCFPARAAPFSGRFGFNHGGLCADNARTGGCNILFARTIAHFF